MDQKEKKDEELFVEACSGNQRSARKLFLRYRNLMFIRIKKRIDSYASTANLAEDIFQDVWEKLWKACGKPGPKENFVGYMSKTLKHKIIDYQRHHIRKGQYILENTSDDDSNSDDSDGITHSSEKINSDLQIQVLEDALKKLPPDQCEAIKLRFQDKTTAEIAEYLGISYEAAKSRIRRARDRIKELLPREYYEKD